LEWIIIIGYKAETRLVELASPAGFDCDVPKCVHIARSIVREEQFQTTVNEVDVPFPKSFGGRARGKR
jgi:hypothetical protein